VNILIPDLEKGYRNKDLLELKPDVLNVLFGVNGAGWIVK
jgi:hypothetical protein